MGVRGSRRHPKDMAVLVAMMVVAMGFSSCSTASSTAGVQQGSPSSTPSHRQSTLWKSLDGTFTVGWSDSSQVKPSTFGAVPFKSYSNVVESLRLVEHVESEVDPSAMNITQTVNLFTATCLGHAISWDGYPAVRCSGSYRPVDIGKVAASTLQELVLHEFASARQEVLIVRDSATHLYIVDAISSTTVGLATGSRFVASFHVLKSSSY